MKTTSTNGNNMIYFIALGAFGIEFSNSFTIGPIWCLISNFSSIICRSFVPSNSFPFNYFWI